MTTPSTLTARSPLAPEQRLWQAMSTGDARAGRAVVNEQLDQGVAGSALIVDLLAPAQLAVGVRWQCGDWTVADEHAATAVVDDALAVVESNAPSPRTGAATLVCACAETEWHEPEFVVRNIWRLYGGWWDGDPAHLKPASASSLAAELAALAGGAHRLAVRAAELATAGDLRLAGHLAELARQAAPQDPAVVEVHADVYARRAAAEASTMAKGVFSWAAKQSMAVTESPSQRPTRSPGSGAVRPLPRRS